MITEIAELVRMYDEEQILTDGEFVTHAVCGCMETAGISEVIEASPVALRPQLISAISGPRFGQGNEFFSSSGQFHSVPASVVEAAKVFLRKAGSE